MFVLAESSVNDESISKRVYCVHFVVMRSRNESQKAHFEYSFEQVRCLTATINKFIRKGGHSCQQISQQERSIQMSHHQQTISDFDLRALMTRITQWKHDPACHLRVQND